MPLRARLAFKLAEVAVAVLLAGPGERGEGGQSTAHHIVGAAGSSGVGGHHGCDLGGQELPIRASCFLAFALVLAALLSQGSELELEEGCEVLPTEATQRGWGTAMGRGRRRRAG